MIFVFLSLQSTQEEVSSEEEDEEMPEVSASSLCARQLQDVYERC